MMRPELDFIQTSLNSKFSFYCMVVFSASEHAYYKAGYNELWLRAVILWTEFHSLHRDSYKTGLGSLLCTHMNPYNYDPEDCLPIFSHTNTCRKIGTFKLFQGT